MHSFFAGDTLLIVAFSHYISWSKTPCPFLRVERKHSIHFPRKNAFSGLLCTPFGKGLNRKNTLTNSETDSFSYKFYVIKSVNLTNTSEFVQNSNTKNHFCTSD